MRYFGWSSMKPWNNNNHKSCAIFHLALLMTASIWVFLYYRQHLHVSPSFLLLSSSIIYYWQSSSRYCIIDTGQGIFCRFLLHHLAWVNICVREWNEMDVQLQFKPGYQIPFFFTISFLTEYIWFFCFSFCYFVNI